MLEAGLDSVQVAERALEAFIAFVTEDPRRGCLQTSSIERSL
jgi:hypothetical protein